MSAKILFDIVVLIIYGIADGNSFRRGLRLILFVVELYDILKLASSTTSFILFIPSLVVIVAFVDIALGFILLHFLSPVNSRSDSGNA
jgi:hypothetical protein